MHEGRRCGVLFDVGHGGISLRWDVAARSLDEGFVPDSISTDLHAGSMNAGMKNMSSVISKFLSLGISLSQVVEASTWRPAQLLHRPDLGHLSPGACADVAVLKIEHGSFGFIDSCNFCRESSVRLGAEVTLRSGDIAWDLNGRAAQPWQTSGVATTG
ncbi:amidohydrolase family protein [Streptomyces sp. x-19]|uniref:amidohydrolase family protein n=1 Tax=Streptomyces sp. x-19 TaxID=2789280 RepID=UPI003980AC6E